MLFTWGVLLALALDTVLHLWASCLQAECERRQAPAEHTPSQSSPSLHRSAVVVRPVVGSPAATRSLGGQAAQATQSKRGGAPAVDLPALRMQSAAPGHAEACSLKQGEVCSLKQVEPAQGCRAMHTNKAVTRGRMEARDAGHGRAVTAPSSGILMETQAMQVGGSAASASAPRRQTEARGSEQVSRATAPSLAARTHSGDAGTEQAASSTSSCAAALPEADLPISVAEVNRSMSIERARKHDEMCTRRLQRQLFDACRAQRSATTPDTSASESCDRLTLEEQGWSSLAKSLTLAEVPQAKGSSRQACRSHVRRPRSASPALQSQCTEQGVEPRRPLYNIVSPTQARPPSRSPSPPRQALSHPTSPGLRHESSPGPQPVRSLPKAMMPYLQSTPSLRAAVARWGVQPLGPVPQLPERSTCRAEEAEVRNETARTCHKPFAPVRACHSLGRLQGCLA